MGYYRRPRGGVPGRRQRHDYPQRCTWCGADYLAKKRTRLGLPTYCSDACRVEAWRARRKNPAAWGKAWGSTLPMRGLYLRAVEEREKKDVARTRAAYLASLPPVEHQGDIEHQGNKDHQDIDLERAHDPPLVE